MKVKELISLLEHYDGERIVILQKDSDGNGYSPLSDVDHCKYLAETTWCGELRPDGDECEGVPCVVLGPVN